MNETVPDASDNSIPGGRYQAVWEAARMLLAPALSAAMCHGMTGVVAHTVGDVETANDLRELLVPGLRALGIEAGLFALPDEDAALALALRERLRYDVQIPLFAFDGSLAPPVFDPEAKFASAGQEKKAAGERRATTEAALEIGEIKEATKWREAVVVRQAIVIGVEKRGRGRWELTLRDTRGVETQTDSTALRADFSHGMRLRHGGAKGTRRAGARDALLRWLAFASACPERALTHNAADLPRRLEAAAFLREIGGETRAPFAARLRQAGKTLARARSQNDIAAALLTMREAVLREMQMPLAMQRALLSSPDLPLGEVERRELIYLARAGTRDLKTLAARRLGAERHHADARSTLDQLAYDADAWVRAASKSSSAD